MKKVRIIADGLGIKVQEVASPFAYGEAKRKFFSSREEARKFFDEFVALPEKAREHAFEEMEDET